LLTTSRGLSGPIVDLSTFSSDKFSLSDDGDASTLILERVRREVSDALRRLLGELFGDIGGDGGKISLEYLCGDTACGVNDKTAGVDVAGGLAASSGSGVGGAVTI